MVVQTHSSCNSQLRQSVYSLDSYIYIERDTITFKLQPNCTFALGESAPLETVGWILGTFITLLHTQIAEQYWCIASASAASSTKSMSMQT